MQGYAAAFAALLFCLLASPDPTCLATIFMLTSRRPTATWMMYRTRWALKNVVDINLQRVCLCFAVIGSNVTRAPELLCFALAFDADSVMGIVCRTVLLKLRSNLAHQIIGYCASDYLPAKNM